MTEPPSVRIAAELRAQIERGELAPGERVPSAREITRRVGRRDGHGDEGPSPRSGTRGSCVRYRVLGRWCGSVPPARRAVRTAGRDAGAPRVACPASGGHRAPGAGRDPGGGQGIVGGSNERERAGGARGGGPDLESGPERRKGGLNPGARTGRPGDAPGAPRAARWAPTGSWRPPSRPPTPRALAALSMRRVAARCSEWRRCRSTGTSTDKDDLLHPHDGRRVSTRMGQRRPSRRRAGARQVRAGVPERWVWDRLPTTTRGWPSALSLTRPQALAEGGVDLQRPTARRAWPGLGLRTRRTAFDNAAGPVHVRPRRGGQPGVRAAGRGRRQQAAPADEWVDDPPGRHPGRARAPRPLPALRATMDRLDDGRATTWTWTGCSRPAFAHLLDGIAADLLSSKR